MSEDIPRNCGACKHFSTEWETGYYGDVSGGMECLKFHWRLNLYDDPSRRTVHETFQSAEDCADYELYRAQDDPLPEHPPYVAVPISTMVSVADSKAVSVSAVCSVMDSKAVSAFRTT